MRITDSMMKAFSRQAVANAQEEFGLAQKHLASGLAVLNPSDDPLRYATATRFKSLVRTREQYIRNINDAKRAMETNEGAVFRITDQLQRVRVLSLQAANGPYTTAELKNISFEFRQILEGILQFANSSAEGGKIFGGTRTDTDPFEAERDANGNITNVIYRGNREAMKRRVSESALIDVNFIGSKLFQIDPDQVTSSATTNFPGQPVSAIAGFGAGETGFFTVQGHRVSFNTTNDSLLDIATRIRQETPEVDAQVTGSLVGTATVANAAAASASTGGTININGTSITLAAGASLNAVVAAVNAVTDQTNVTASVATVAGGFALQLDGGAEITDTGAGTSNALTTLGATSGAAAPTNLTSRNALAYRLQITTQEPDQLFLTDEPPVTFADPAITDETGRFLERLGMIDGTNNAPANVPSAQQTDISLFNVLIDTLTDLEQGDSTSIRTTHIGEIDRALEKFHNVLAKVSAKANRLESEEGRAEEFILQAKSVISVNEDLDLAEAVTNLQKLQIKLQTAISSVSTISSTNLLNYL